LKTKYFKVVLIYWAVIGLGGCGENGTNQRTELSPPMQTKIPIVPIKDQKVTGRVRSTEFSIEQAIIEYGSLILRQGEDVFADASVKVVTFDSEGFEGKTFSSSKSTDPFTDPFKPQVILSIKEEEKNLPDQITLLNDYELLLSFGKKKSLGIPFSIRLVSLENDTYIEGKSFATYENIRVVDDVIDTQFDSFDTLEYLAKQYIAKQPNEIKLGQVFGLSSLGYGKDYPKSGFVGYEAITGSGEQLIIKIQLAKDKNGWRVTNQLNANQIHQAHPVLTSIEGSLRTQEGIKARQAAGQKLEAYLNEETIIRSIRSTSINCYLTDSAHKASCKAVYGLKLRDEVECYDQNYLLTNDGNSWQFESEILANQKVHSISGELVTKKTPKYPFPMTCQ